jgi:hypothetical protein
MCILFPTLLITETDTKGVLFLRLFLLAFNPLNCRVIAVNDQISHTAKLQLKA